MADAEKTLARVLAPRGLFALAVEGLESGDYRLQPTGRYAQSPAYLRTLAAQAGLAAPAVPPLRHPSVSATRCNATAPHVC